MRTGGQTSGVRERQRLGRSISLGECLITDHERRGEQHRDAGEEPAQPAVRSTRANGVALRCGATRSEELPFEIVQIRLVRFGPLPRRGRSSASVEIGGITPPLVPCVRGLRDVTMELASLRIVLEPGPKPRPLMEQRLVGDLGRPFGDGDEAGVGEDRHRARRVGVAVQVELRERRATSDHLRPFARCRQAKQDALGRRLPVGIEPVEGLLRQPCDGPLHPSGTKVVVEVKGPIPTAGPQLEERRREERESSWLIERVRHERIREVCVDLESRTFGGTFDRSSEFLVVHRADQDLTRREQRGERAVPSTMSIEVRAHRDHRRDRAVRIQRGSRHPVEECVPLGVI